MARLSRPELNEFAPFYRSYIESLSGDDVLEILDRQIARFEEIREQTTPDRETYRYADGKWSIRELIGHLGDAERVFAYRAMCISRGDQTPLPGFDENEYVAGSSSNERPLSSLVAELVALRKANLELFRHLSEDSGARVGNANGSPISVRALAWIIAGHAAHHLRVLEERYAK